MKHALKTLPQFYERVDAHEKNFEVRKHDRPFEVGDYLLLQEFQPENVEDGETFGYTGRELTRKIIYILVYGEFPQGLKPGYCILGLEE